MCILIVPGRDPARDPRDYRLIWVAAIPVSQPAIGLSEGATQAEVARQRGTSPEHLPTLETGPDSPPSSSVVRTYRRLAPVGSDGFILGSDQLGRDILSRLLYGARTSLIIALVPLTASVALGVALGLISGYYGKLVDMISGRVFDILLAFPAILLAIGIVAALGPGMINAMLAIVVIAIPENARIVRGMVLTLKELEYVEAARVIGASNRRIMWRHILPNSLPSIIVFTSLNLGRLIIFAAGLSFLGLGPQPPTAEWGSMLAQGRTVLPIAPHVATIPGLAIFTVVLGANLFGDGLRDILDPRLRNA